MIKKLALVEGLEDVVNVPAIAEAIRFVKVNITSVVKNSSWK
jgi:hypothetical protein